MSESFTVGVAMAKMAQAADLVERAATLVRDVADNCENKAMRYAAADAYSWIFGDHGDVEWGEAATRIRRAGGQEVVS